MATLTVKLSLVSTNATSDSLNLNVTDTVAFSNDVVQKRFATSTTAAKFLEADEFNIFFVNFIFLFFEDFHIFFICN